MGYSNSSRFYWVFNKCTLCIEEYAYVIFDDSNHVIEHISNRKDEDEREKVANITIVDPILESTSVENSKPTTAMNEQFAMD